MVKRDEGSDPASVVFDTIAKAKSVGADVIICDTAGRLHNKKNLMDELAKISRIIDRELPDCDKEVLLVLDATTGQNAVNQAREFKNAAGISGIVLTKLDGTAKAAWCLLFVKKLQLPVKFIGVGEKYRIFNHLMPMHSLQHYLKKEMMMSRKQMRVKTKKILTIFIRINIYEIYYSNS